MCKDYEKIIIFFLRFLCHTLVTLPAKLHNFKHNLTQTKHHQFHRLAYSNNTSHNYTKLSNINTYGLITRRSIVRVYPPQPKRSKSFRDLLFFIFPQKVPFGEILGKKTSQLIDISNKISVKDYGKPKK